MIGHLRGRVLRATGDQVVVDTTGGVGYLVSVPLPVRQALGPPGSDVELHVHTNVREDQIALYGFGTLEELDMFRMLIEVDGVGPKVALGILSSASLDVLKRAILAEDVAPVRRAPGVGAKTAAKVIIELRPRLESEAQTLAIARPANGTLPAAPAAAQVEDALRSLGYSAQEARAGIDAVDWGGEPDTQEAIAQALRALRR